MDQHKEEEQKNTQELMDQLKEEEEKNSEEVMVSSPFAHPCSLLQYILQACACCLGLRDSFSDPKPADSAARVLPASQEEDELHRKTSEDRASAQMVAANLVSRPKHPKTPREGSGGNGGIHH